MPRRPRAATVTATESAPADTTIDGFVHYETRSNNPTTQLREFGSDYGSEPAFTLYPRQMTEPHLVWWGKEEQDAHDLVVPTVPIYIQEKILPRALIEDLKRGVGQMDLFADYDAITDLAEKVEFYQHQEKWQNRFILGDSLVVMNSLAEKEGLKGKVQCIYIDPPYGIKFGSNWQASTRKRDVKDGKLEDATRQPEQVKAYRDTWELGIHSYLAYLRDRLSVARELLTETGSIFVQIGDENVHLVRSLMDEVFGSDNFCGQIQFNKTGGFSGNLLSLITDTLIWYSRSKVVVKYRALFLAKKPARDAGQYDWIETPEGVVRELTDGELEDVNSLGNEYKILAHQGMASQGVGSTASPIVFHKGREYLCPASSHWKTTPVGIWRLDVANRIFGIGQSLRYKRLLEDFPVLPTNNVWMDMGTSGFGEKKRYVVETNAKVIERCILMTTDPGDLVLDPTCGSGTTAFVAEKWGRRWITIDTSRVALALARTRLMAARFPHYLLRDSEEGERKFAEISGFTPPPRKKTWQNDLRDGFVYKTVPHVTLKSIANNAEIDEIHARFQPALEELRSKLNDALRQDWQEWEIPRIADEKWSAQTEVIHSAWWAQRRARQAEMDASIARNADTETLYDQPYEVTKRVRVSGPFTVESLSPHRILDIDANRDGDVTPNEVREEADYVQVILDNLRIAGVQNTYKDQRITFSTLEPWPGEWIQASGTYEDANGKEVRVAVSIGPEYGTVNKTHITRAAIEAKQGIPFEILVICAFAYEAEATESLRQIGNLQILPARTNADILLGESALKKTGAGNLFMVFGEPDIELRPAQRSTGKDEWEVEIYGLDIYNPTIGKIESSKGTEDIACWFLDTDYNEESFFVRHAYFTGANDPYKSLKTALKAEIDESAWESIYRNISRPFARPSSGKIAVKVINHYGDEVLKVYSVP